MKNPTKATVIIKRLGINGEGIAYYQNKILFVPNALPKEKVLCEIISSKGNFFQGKLLKILKKSPQRVTPPCPIYDTCGGCQLQHLNSAGQLVFKKDLLKQALHKFKPEGFKNYLLKDTLGMNDPWYYRNKAQFPLRLVQGKIKAGLFKENSHDLIPLENCLVQLPLTQKIANYVVSLMEKYHLSPFNEKKNTGDFKTLVIRCNEAQTEAQLVVVTRTDSFPFAKEMIAEVTKKFPEIKSFMQNIQPEKTSLIFGEKTKELWGVKTIEETINHTTFSLSPRAFFQLNPAQTKVLYAEAKKALEPNKNETLIDAYCGVGTIGLSLAPFVKEVRGMDIIPEAIEDAKENAKRLNLENTHYFVGKAEQLIPQWTKENFVADGIIVDPPRSGLDDALLKTLMTHPVKKLVYVSCNVSTLARDLVTLGKKYHVEYLQSVDMFPQTARCEVVVKMRLKTI